MLRNNKEAGPYSFDDLLQIGFKPYDLIWVEGESAMWRYPSEVPELKDYSEAVEEQPYDRFYKKKNIEADSLQKQDSSVKKQVYVSLPVKPLKEIKTESPLSKETVSSAISPTATTTVAEVKFAQPLEEIKEMYSKNLQHRNQKIAQQKIMFRHLKKAAFFTGLVMLGVIMGYMITRGKNNAPALVVNSEPAAPTAALPASSQIPHNKDGQIIPEEILETNKAESLVSTDDIGLLKKEGIQKTQNKVAGQPPVMSTGKENKQQPISSDKIEQITPGTETNSLTGARNKKSRIETGEAVTIPEKKDNDLSKLVTVTSNNYQRGAFGGIRNLELTLTNHSNFFLNKVTVELQYLKPSEHTLRSENILFSSIPPDGTLTIAVPPSNRGIKVQFRIIKIESKEQTNATANL